LKSHCVLEKILNFEWIAPKVYYVDGTIRKSFRKYFL